MKIRFLFLCSFFTLTACQIGYVPIDLHHQIQSQNISLYNAELKNCTFHPQSRIVHFPMYHYPVSGNYDEIVFDQTSKSQFQLLRTILAYAPNISVFDESVTSDNFDQYFIDSLKRGHSKGTFSTLSGEKFHYSEMYKQAYTLFGNGIPMYYEHLSQEQKAYLFQFGASYTLFFLELIPEVHKVISTQDFNLVKANVRDPTTGQINDEDPNNAYWILHFREQKLREEVLKLYLNTSSNNLILIAYGANHNFSDDFLGYPFEAGTFCLNWLPRSFQITPS